MDDKKAPDTEQTETDNAHLWLILAELKRSRQWKEGKEDED